MIPVTDYSRRYWENVGFLALWLAQNRRKRGNWPQSTAGGRAGANFRALA
jgi:hypothetical protein